MMVLGYKARYGGRFGSVPVIQAGGYKLVQVKDYPSMPLPLMVLLMKADEAGADFLVIDDRAVASDKANWIDVREAA